jgi:predicted glutamine amidotransferase
MCGIVGYIAADKSGYPDSQLHFMRYALMLDELRGADSTGLIQVDTDFKVNAFRSILPGHQFIGSELFKENGGVGWCGIGHNRSATRGAVALDNAHPFRFGAVTLVHNGTLNHWGASLPTFQKGFAVDSMQIAYAMAQHEPEQAKEVLEKIDGDFAIVWVDERDQSVNMARNNARPMHFTWNPSRSFMMFMSDGHMLTTINKSLRWSGAQGGSIYQVDSFKHLKWKFGSLEPEVQSFDPFVKPRPVGMAPAGGSLRTAVARAQEKWGDRSSTGSTSGYTDVIPPLKVVIDGKKRKVPMAHIEALQQFFGLKPDEYLRFTPEDAADMSPDTVYVGGQVDMLHWGACPWEAVLMNVPKTFYTNYSDLDWTVRPIGLTRRMGTKVDNLPSVLCQFVKAKWDPVEQPDDVTQCDAFDTVPFEDAIVEDNFAVEDSKRQAMQDEMEHWESMIIPGPSGCLVGRGKLIAQLTDGCVNCGGFLSIERSHTYEYANDGADIICDDCRWNMED